MLCVSALMLRLVTIDALVHEMARGGVNVHARVLDGAVAGALEELF